MKWTRTTGFLFLAAAAVFPGSALFGAPEKQATGAATGAPTSQVKLLDEAAGPTAIAQAAPAVAEVVPPAKPAAAPQVNVSDAGTVEIHVNEASLVEVLRMLSTQAQKNIITTKDVKGTVTANLYKVTIREALDAILKANGFAYREKGNFIYVYTAKELADIEKAERQTVTEVFHLHYTPAVNAQTMLKPVLSLDGIISVSAPADKGISSGSTGGSSGSSGGSGGSGGGDAGGNSHASDDIIVVKDYPENMKKVKELLKEIDRRPQQVLVEATIVSASLTEDNAFGIDFTVIGGVDFSGIKGLSSSTSDILSGKVIDNAAATDKGVGAGQTGFTSKVPSGGLRVGVATNNVAAFLTALETVSDTTVLANPKILTLNKQRGEVLVGREDGYLTTTVTQTTSVQAVEFLKTGTRLIFRPYIGNDGYIRMEVHPESSDGHVINGLPTKSTTEITSNIMVKDGHTIVIGGLFRESNTVSKGQIPGLGNVPIVGALFRNHVDATVREEIIILLTPHIVKDDQAYSKASEEELKDLEKLRVGVRHGMMPLGRERLAASCYDSAVSEMSKSNPDSKKAMWYLDCATNLNPKFIEAIKMKETLTGHEVTSVDNSTFRGFVRRQIMAERGSRAATENNEPIVEPEANVPAAEPEAAPVPVPAEEAANANPAARTAPAKQPAATASADKSAAAQPQKGATPAANNAKPAAVTQLPFDEDEDDLPDLQPPSGK
jgi:type IV pilus assembly protein PilQ